MSKLPSGIFSHETIINVDWFRLADALHKATGVQYELDGIRNDTDHKCYVKSILNSSDSAIYREMKLQPNVQDYEMEILLSGLCSEGIIAPGIYLISVSW
jgi:hypothetical protein